MNGFTPGPWIIFYDNGLNVILPAMRDGTIADMIRNDDDAYLIAAAPDLLAALRGVLPFAEREIAKAISKGYRERVTGVVNAALTAIAKAEGRS